LENRAKSLRMRDSKVGAQCELLLDITFIDRLLAKRIEEQPKATGHGERIRMVEIHGPINRFVTPLECPIRITFTRTGEPYNEFSRTRSFGHE
jgi:hypothetical protein